MQATDSKVRNVIIAIVAIVLSVALALGLRFNTTPTSLDGMAAKSVPFDTALRSNQPILLEFYANWCSSCQAMSADLQSLKTDYGDRVSFVMLNVDNEKWLPEIVRYKVDGIPHFVYMDAQGETVAQAIGEQPKLIMAENLTALSTGGTLPHIQSQGQISEYSPPVAVREPKNDDPRAHGSSSPNARSSAT